MRVLGDVPAIGTPLLSRRLGAVRSRAGMVLVHGAGAVSGAAVGGDSPIVARLPDAATPPG
jgi:hypothetical protein